MNIEQLEGRLESLTSPVDRDEFIYGLLQAYDLPKASLTRLKKGDYNLSKTPGEVLWKKKLFFKVVNEGDLHVVIDDAKEDPAVMRHHPRFLVVTDFRTLLSVDTKTSDSLDIALKNLAQNYDFFLPWAGLEKTQIQSENPADIKAARRMGQLYDLILSDNSIDTDEDRHALNVFLARLLFCFFAEDTGIFKEDQFTKGVASQTSDDGSDLQDYIRRVFTVLSSPKRKDLPRSIKDFPYVNGGLFSDELLRCKPLDSASCI